MALLDSHREPNERYPLLRVVGPVVVGLGAFELILGTLLLALGLYALNWGTPQLLPGAPLPGEATAVSPLRGKLGGAFAVVSSLSLLVSGVVLVALGTLIKLAIHVEENTRATAQSLEKLCSRDQSDVPADGAESIFVS